jgi:integrase
MARHGDYLYRRTGHFYARIRVPQLLELAYGKSHLRASLHTTDYREARLRVLEMVLSWKRDFLRLCALLDARQVVAGSALLLGDGLIPLESAARECGLRVEEMLSEAVNRAAELRVEGSGWQGSEMPADDLDYDYDGTLVLNSADGHDKTAITGPLFLRRAALALVSNGLFEDCLFFRDGARKRAIVVPLPGVSTPIGSLLISKKDAEAIRASIAAGVTPAMLDAADKRRLQQAHSLPTHKYDGMKTSELLEEFFKSKGSSWAESTKKKMSAMCGVFVELMNDPTVGEIDRVMIHRYGEQLLTLPADLPASKRRLGVTALADLIAAGAELSKMAGSRADEYVSKIGEAFAWAERKGFMLKNPSIGAVERKKKVRRNQDERNELTGESLRLIFSSPWFVSGKGKRTSRGTYRTFQPHQYWLPAMALFTGGRLNELAQLYLADIQCTIEGTWFIDFNFDGAGKIDDPDKSLKSVNSVRCVPLHPELVRLGLPEYVHALALAGYERLFPELLFDEVKGYGKPAGHWFNERFMGEQLKIPRDGMQTFHSFRHNFINAMFRLEPSVSEFDINQLSGHERGKTMSAGRYAKDSPPDVLHVHIKRLNFSIPPIEKFDIAEGLAAVRDALERKHKTTKPSS